MAYFRKKAYPYKRKFTRTSFSPYKRSYARSYKPSYRKPFRATCFAGKPSMIKKAPVKYEFKREGEMYVKMPKKGYTMLRMFHQLPGGVPDPSRTNKEYIYKTGDYARALSTFMRRTEAEPGLTYALRRNGDIPLTDPWYIAFNTQIPVDAQMVGEDSVGSKRVRL